jgi:hypothetical protein
MTKGTKPWSMPWNYEHGVRAASALRGAACDRRIMVPGPCEVHVGLECIRLFFRGSPPGVPDLP